MPEPEPELPDTADEEQPDTPDENGQMTIF